MSTRTQPTCQINSTPGAASNGPSNGGKVDPREFGLVKAAYAVNETLELLSIGRTSLYEAVKRGHLTPVKFGSKTLFLAADIAGFLLQLRDPHGSRRSNPKKVAPPARRFR